MTNEFPRMLYRAADKDARGARLIHGHWLHTSIAHDEEQLAAAHIDGWRTTTTEAAATEPKKSKQK